MKYIVLSPEHQLMGFEHKEQIMEYCLEIAGEALNDYCKDQGLEYANMSSTEIGQLYTNIGVQSGECLIYETDQVLKVLKEKEVEAETIEQAKSLFERGTFDHPIKCPSFIEDVLEDLTALSISDLTDGIYFMDNIDSSKEESDNG